MSGLFKTLNRFSENLLTLSKTPLDKRSSKTPWRPKHSTILLSFQHEFQLTLEQVNKNITFIILHKIMLFDEFQSLDEVSSTRVGLHEKRAKWTLTINQLVVTVFWLIFNHRYITHQYDVVELLFDWTELY